jgi:hypothetical protein
VTTALTDADLTYFWVGPLGYLVRLPLLPVGGSSDTSEELIGALQVSLAGSATLDVFGHKRTWQLDWVCLSQAETAAVHAWSQGLTTTALRLVDPRAGNWLTRDGASGGSYHRDTRAHTLTSGSGTVLYGPVGDYPTGLIGLVDGGVSWAVPAATAAMIVTAKVIVPIVSGMLVEPGGATAAKSAGSRAVTVVPTFWEIAIAETRVRVWNSSG